MNIIPIAFAFDNNLAFPACVCLSSLMMHAKPDTFYDIFILHSEKEELQKEELNKLPTYYPNCRITYRTVDGTFDQAYEIRGITTPAYYRLLIPKLIPEYDKIIYSDVDVIFRLDLSEIFETNLDEYYFAGVNSLSHRIPELVKYYTKIGLDPKKIIYSGNLIINNKLINKNNIIEEFLKHITCRFKFQDMDIINMVCKGKVKFLPPLFCATIYLYLYDIYNKTYLYEFWNETEIHNAKNNGIIHYNGQKPWNQYSVNFDIWWEYYRKSPYYNEKTYFDYYYSKLNILDQLSLFKRIKLIARYFIYGIRKY